MKTTCTLLIVMLLGLLFSAACQGGGSFSGPHCVEGTCVRVDAASQEGGVGSIVPVTVIVESEVEVEDLHMTLFALPGFADVVGESQWTVHVLPNQPITRTGGVRPKGEGYVQVVGQIAWGKGPRYTQDSIDLYATATHVIARPTAPYPRNVITLPSGATRVLPVPPPREPSPDPSRPRPTIRPTLGAGTPSSIPTPPIPIPTHPGSVMPSPPLPGARPTSPPTKYPK